MSTMKVATVLAHGKPLVIRDEPIPVIDDDEILVKLETSGVCHTDVHVNDGDWSVKCPIPMIPGHEGAGFVTKVGANVKDVKVGDRVGVPWLHRSCLSCYDCRNGWETVCTDQLQTGFTVQGGFAEYVKAPAAFVGHIPDNVPFEQASPVLCAGVTVYKGLKVSEVKPGQTVVIVGAAGGLGHVAVQYAKAMGMTVIGVDIFTEPKAKMMKGLGVTHMVDPKKDNVPEAIRKITGGEGAHGAVILAPIVTAFTEAVEYLRPRGVLVCIALPPGGFQTPILPVTLKAITIRGSIVGTRNDLQEALDFAAQGKVKCHVEMRKFSEVNDILQELREGKVPGRVVLDMKTVGK